MSMSLRIIKIVTPANECINLELGGDEAELLDLLSMVCGIPQSEIKGLKDCYGNYYTVSSAVSNPNINSDNSEVYYLICNQQYGLGQVINNYGSEKRPASVGIEMMNAANHMNHANSLKQMNPNPISPPTSSSLNSNMSCFTFNNGNNFRGNMSPSNSLSRGNSGSQNPNYSNNNYNLHNINMNSQRKNQSVTRADSLGSGVNYYPGVNSGNSLTSNGIGNGNTNVLNYKNLNTRSNLGLNNDIFNFNNYSGNNNNNYSRPPTRQKNTNLNLPGNRNNNNNSNNFNSQFNSNLNNEFSLHRNNESNNIPNQDTGLFKIRDFSSKLSSFSNSNNNEFPPTHSQSNINPDYNGITNTINLQNSRLTTPPSLEYTNYSQSNLAQLRYGEMQMTNPMPSNRENREHNNNIEKYLLVAQDLYENHQIDSTACSKLSQLILKENDEVINLMKVFCTEIIDKRSLLSGVNKILNSFNQLNLINSRPTSPIQEKTKLMGLIEQLDGELFEDKSEAVLLRNLVEYENEFIMGAFEVYESDKDLDNFIESIRILINRSKRKPSLYQLSKENAMFRHGNAKIGSQMSSTHKNTNIENLEDDIKNSDFKKKSSSSIDYKVSNTLNKEIESQILACLHTEERIIFKYSLKNKLQEIEVISQLFETFLKTDLLIKPVKYLCKKFINENVIKSLDEPLKQKFLELLSNREKNKNLVTIFKDFKDHQSLLKLEKDVYSFIKVQVPSSSISKTRERGSTANTEKKRGSSSETGSILDVDESIVKEKRTDRVEREINNNESNLEEFVNLINVMKFLKPEEKRELEKMMQNRNKFAMEVVENYYKNKSIVSLKSSVLNLVRKKNSILSTTTNNNNNSLVQNTYSTVNSVESTSKNSLSNYQGKIFKKLESQEILNSNSKTKTNSNANVNVNKDSNINTNKIKRNSNIISTTKDSPSKPFTNIESLLDDLEKSGKISSLQHKYIDHRYKNNDDVVNSAWEVYLKTKDLPELIESLKVFTSNIKKMNQSNPPPVTPADLKESKKEIIEFLKLKSNKKEKETVKIMQYNMIKILARDNSIEKNYLPILKEMILEENPFLISAFEVFGVTKDHKDFSHTINMIAYLYNRNANGNSSNSNAIVEERKGSPKVIKDDKLAMLFEAFMKKTNSFGENEKEILKKKLREKNQMIMSSLELYEIYEDAEELLDTLKILAKK